MNACERLRQSGAYHDGELSGQERRSFETHLAGCEQCRAECAQLAALSRLMAAARIPDMSPETLARLRENAVSAPDRVVLRLAERLIGVAATLAVAAFGWLAAGPGSNESLATDAGWLEAAVTSTDAETVSSDMEQVTQWMAQELAMENGND